MRLCFDESLRDWFPEHVDVEASSAFDAISIIANQHPLKGKIDPIPMCFKEFMSYEIATDPTLRGRTFTLTKWNEPLGGAYQGSGGGRRGAIVTIVVAVALIVITHGASAATSTSAASSSMFTSVVGSSATAMAANQAIMQIGVSLLLQGLIGLLSPQKKIDRGASPNSYTFGAGQNTTDIGTIIPMILGQYLATAQVLSFNINSRNNPSGIDDPDTSAYFNGKADVNLPNINLAKFYGLVRAGDSTRILQQDNTANRTGTEFQ